MDTRADHGQGRGRIAAAQPLPRSRLWTPCSRPSTRRPPRSRSTSAEVTAMDTRGLDSSMPRPLAAQPLPRSRPWTLLAQARDEAAEARSTSAEVTAMDTTKARNLTTRLSVRSTSAEVTAMDTSRTKYGLDIGSAAQPLPRSRPWTRPAYSAREREQVYRSTSAEVTAMDTLLLHAGLAGAGHPLNLCRGHGHGHTGALGTQALPNGRSTSAEVTAMDTRTQYTKKSVKLSRSTSAEVTAMDTSPANASVKGATTAQPLPRSRPWTQMTQVVHRLQAVRSTSAEVTAMDTGPARPGARAAGTAQPLPRSRPWTLTHCKSSPRNDHGAWFSSTFQTSSRSGVEWLPARS